MGKSNKLSCVNLFPNQSANYKLEVRFVELTGKCTTRKATQEELDRYKK